MSCGEGRAYVYIYIYIYTHTHTHTHIFNVEIQNLNCCKLSFVCVSVRSPFYTGACTCRALAIPTPLFMRWMYARRMYVRYVCAVMYVRCMCEYRRSLNDKGSVCTCIRKFVLLLLVVVVVFMLVVISSSSIYCSS